MFIRICLDTIRRRAGLRGTFSAYRNPLTASSIQPQSREKSPQNNRTSFTRTNLFTVLPPPPAQKIDKDIIKHAARIRRMSQSKELLTKYSTMDANTSTDTSPPRTSSTKKSTSNNKPSKGLSLVSRIEISSRRWSIFYRLFFDECNEYSWRETSN